MSRANGQISSSSRQGAGEVAEVTVLPVVGESAGATHSASLSRARERALLRCLRTREAARAGGGDSIKGEKDITTMC